MANTWWQNRQVFWRSGVSTTSEPAGLPTGHASQTVAQKTRLTRSVGASRQSEGLEVLRSRPSPHPPSLQRTRRPDHPSSRRGGGRWRSRGRTKRAHRCLEISPRTRDSHERPPPLSFSADCKNEEHLRRHAFRFTRFQVSGDSNGPVEGQVNRLKTIKRQMYGRAGVELLRARLIPLSP